MSLAPQDLATHGIVVARRPDVGRNMVIGIFSIAFRPIAVGAREAKSQCANNGEKPHSTVNLGSLGAQTDRGGGLVEDKYRNYFSQRRNFDPKLYAFAVRRRRLAAEGNLPKNLIYKQSNVIFAADSGIMGAATPRPMRSAGEGLLSNAAVTKIIIQNENS